MSRVADHEHGAVGVLGLEAPEDLARREVGVEAPERAQQQGPAGHEAGGLVGGVHLEAALHELDLHALVGGEAIEPDAAGELERQRLGTGGGVGRAVAGRGREGGRAGVVHVLR